jgi:lipid-A-disaccharide synthase
VSFTGHPLVDAMVIDKTTREARAALGLDEALTIGLFPGSRGGEIERLLPVQLGAATLLRQHYPACRFVLPRAPTISETQLARWQSELDVLGVQVISGHTRDVIQACDVIMVTSGTATLEIGLMEKPMVIMHKLAPLSYAILRRLVTIKYIGLVNIVPGKAIVREFIQYAATPANIAGEVMQIIDDANYRRTMINELGKLRGLLGDGGGAAKVAKLAYDMLQGS